MTVLANGRGRFFGTIYYVAAQRRIASAELANRRLQPLGHVSGSDFGDLTQAIPTELLANLIHFDYSRDVTFIAIGTEAVGETIACGVVDAFISPGKEEAEYSILIHCDLAGTGLGKALMMKIISYCRAQGVGT